MSDTDEIKALMLQTVEDCKKTPPSEMRVELTAAGWRNPGGSVWIDPKGNYCLGPYVAWKKMQKGAK